MSEHDFIERLPKFWQAISNESVASTRILIEWLIVLGLVKFPRKDSVRNLLARFDEISSSTGTFISLLTISMHFGLCLENTEDQAHFISEAFHYIIPNFSHNNHVVRLYALYAYQRLWQCAKINP